MTIVMNEQERKDTLRKHVRQLKEDIAKAEHKLKEAQVRNQSPNTKTNMHTQNAHHPNTPKRRYTYTHQSMKHRKENGDKLVLFFKLKIEQAQQAQLDRLKAARHGPRGLAKRVEHKRRYGTTLPFTLTATEVRAAKDS
jgi:hypothetical protein